MNGQDWLYGGKKLSEMTKEELIQIIVRTEREHKRVMENNSNAFYKMLGGDL